MSFLLKSPSFHALCPCNFRREEEEKDGNDYFECEVQAKDFKAWKINPKTDSLHFTGKRCKKKKKCWNYHNVMGSPLNIPAFGIHSSMQCWILVGFNLVLRAHTTFIIINQKLKTHDREWINTNKKNKSEMAFHSILMHCRSPIQTEQYKKPSEHQLLFATTLKIALDAADDYNDIAITF